MKIMSVLRHPANVYAYIALVGLAGTVCCAANCNWPKAYQCNFCAVAYCNVSGFIAIFTVINAGGNENVVHLAIFTGSVIPLVFVNGVYSSLDASIGLCY